MLDFGWAELFMIAAVAVFVIGPKEIPTLMRSLGRLMRRLQYIKYSISNQFDEFMGDDMSVNFEADKKDLPEGHEAFDELAEDEELITVEADKDKEVKQG